MRSRYALSTVDSRLVAGKSVVAVSSMLSLPQAFKRIQTNIAYFPASQPFPASQKRREAYEAGGFLPCPINDPEGWLASPMLTIYGVVNSDALRPRHSKAHCMVRVVELRQLQS